MNFAKTKISLITLLTFSFASGECVDKMDPSYDWMVNQSRLPPALSMPKSFTIDFLDKGTILKKREFFKFNKDKIAKYVSYTGNEKISINYQQNGKDMLEGKGQVTKSKTSSREVTPQSMSNLDSKERTNADFRKVYIRLEDDGFIFNANLLNEQSVEWRYNTQGLMIMTKEGKWLNTVIAKFDDKCRIVGIYDSSDESEARNVYNYKSTSTDKRMEYVAPQPGGDQDGFFIFNESGLLERNFFTFSEGTADFMYKYDQYNNWTEQVYKENGKLTLRIVRTLEY
ncbi:hypothetical protein [Deinococcus sp. Leaf326]|uniref:hypothetical protein n=1 Tax=Deinococcus sp. Leaf326 TaxID=1736338 RepID=UPI0012E1F994|nr:hypothetical protein [Deinococcus sp. Leaf326]